MKEQKPDSAFDEEGDSYWTEDEPEKQASRSSRSKGSLNRRKKEPGEVTQKVRTRQKARKGNARGGFMAFLRMVLLLVGIMACLAVAGGIWAGERIPQMAAQKFGPASPELSLPQRVLYSVRLLANEHSLLNPLDAAGKPRSFEVTLGETVNSIATRLEEEGFVANADTFRAFLIYAGLDKGVQAGEYQLSPAMSEVQIAHALQDAAPEEVKFNILPGWRADEIAAALPTSGLAVSQDEFLQLVHDPPVDLLPSSAPNITTLEGFLLPGSYQVKRTISAHGLVALFIARFDEQVTPDMRDAFMNHKLDLAEAVALASMVQREAIVADEQPVIASVFYNRLEGNMKLDSDPTVQYALGYDPEKHTWWKNPLTTEDLQVNSRYNTYIYPGLPPSPIDNPGIDALRAVANPAQTGFYYFRAKCDGSGRHAFSATYEEHLQNACP